MAEINGKKISRSYTPTTPEEGRGHFDLVIKVRTSLYIYITDTNLLTLSK
jgi:hypothetical protein